MKPTPEIKSYLTSILLIEAYIETIRPEIEAIYNEVFFYMIPDRLRVNHHTKEPITDQKYSYTLDYQDAETKNYIDAFGDEAKKVLIERGWKPSKPDCCYLLECEGLLRDLQRYFIQECIKTLPQKVKAGMSDEQYYENLNYSLKLYKKFLEINKSYFIQYIDKKDLLADYKPDFNNPIA